VIVSCQLSVISYQLSVVSCQLRWFLRPARKGYAAGVPPTRRALSTPSAVVCKYGQRTTDNGESHIWPIAVRVDSTSVPNRSADREANDRGNRSRRRPRSILARKRPNQTAASLPSGIEPLFSGNERVTQNTWPAARSAMSGEIYIRSELRTSTHATIIE
jgi:hypothetical protein